MEFYSKWQFFRVAGSIRLPLYVLTRRRRVKATRYDPVRNVYLISPDVWKTGGKSNMAEDCDLMSGQVMNYAWEKERKKIINGWHSRLVIGRDRLFLQEAWTIFNVKHFFT